MNASQNQIMVWHPCAFIIHKLNKEAHQTTVDLELNTEVLNHKTTEIQQLVQFLAQKYQQQVGKVFGQFEADLLDFPFQQFLITYLADQSFYTFSCEIMLHLKRCIETAPPATGGYIVITHLKSINQHHENSEDYLLVAMVSNVLGLAVTKQLELEQTMHLDINHLRIAGMINLTRWQNKEDRYIGFIKGKDQIANYFRYFLGCNHVVSANRESQKLITTLLDFSQQQLEATKRDNFLKNANSYLLELNKQEHPLSLTTLANYLYPENPDLLGNYFTQPDHELLEGYIPNRNCLKKLLKFEAITPYWSVRFDREAILREELNYDARYRVLQLKNIPVELHEQLLKEFGTIENFELSDH